MTSGALTRRSNPWNDLLSLQEEMNRLFETSMGSRQGATGLLGSDYLPAVDVIRNEHEIIVRADLPGVAKEDIDLTVLNNRLFIRGEKKHQNEQNEGNAHRLERYYGSFERIIELPTPVNPESIKASFRDGVLEVKAPIADEARPKKIDVDVK